MTTQFPSSIATSRLPRASIDARTTAAASRPTTVAEKTSLVVVLSVTLRPSNDGSPRAIVRRSGQATTTTPRPLIISSYSAISPISLWCVVPPSESDLRELEVVAPASIPFDGGGGPGEDLGLRPVGPEGPLLVDADLVRTGIQDGEPDPAVAAENADSRVPLHDPEHRFRRRLDEEERAD